MKALLALALLLSPSAHAAWSCECAAQDESGDQVIYLVDGETENDARRICVSEEEGPGGQVIRCLPRGRGDR